MPDVAGFLGRLIADPAFAYLAAATAMLVAVAVWAGIARRDLLALAHPLVFLKLAAAVALAVLAAHGAARLEAALGPDAGAWTHLHGIHRAPLYAIALAYGPSLGILAGASYLVAATLGATPHPATGVLLVELAVLGWLAIFPSPWRHRWAGPADALAAYALAWATAGLAWIAAGDTGVGLEEIMAQHDERALGTLVACVALTAVGPGAYRRLFPESRIQDSDAAEAPPS